MKRTLVLLFALAIIASNLLSQPVIEGVYHRGRSFGLYEKVEITLRFSAEYTNPFDPGQLDITATFTAPSGKTWKVPGFYHQGGWSGFAIRFSADEAGEWFYNVGIRDRNGETTSEQKSFNVVPSEYHGPIKITKNKRYLEHKDGTSWFGVGMWYNGDTDTEVLDELQEKGVNFVSHLIVPLETRGSGLGRYDQLVSQQIDELLENLEEREMQLALNFWFHSFLSETVWGGGNIAWYTNPYQEVCDAKEFFSSEEAWQYQEKLYRYMIARWGYSRSLAIWFIVDEVNGTDGWVMGDSIGAAKWVAKVHNYFKENDPWQHLTTGTRSGGVDEWWDRGYAVLDMSGREIYEAQGFPINPTGQVAKDKTHPLTYSYRNYHGEVHKLWRNFEKPAIIPETGWDHTFYEMSMPEYQAQFHNAMWVCLASGSAMSPFWWSYSNSLNDNVVTNQFQSIQRFTSAIPFSSLTNLTPIVASNKGTDVYAISSDQLIFGWAANMDTDMSGKIITLPEITRGTYRLKLYHTWRGRFLRPDGTSEWLGGRTGDSERGRESGTLLTGSKNGLSFQIPVLKIEDGHAKYIGKDVAFVLEKEE